MRIYPDPITGHMTADYPPTFYRVSTWGRNYFVADFTKQSEAAAFAISDAKERGCRYDHAVSEMHLIRA